MGVLELQGGFAHHQFSLWSAFQSPFYFLDWTLSTLTIRDCLLRIADVVDGYGLGKEG